MPSLQGRSLGIFPDMDEKEHRILEVGIPLFQLVYPFPLKFDMDVHGPYSATVTSPDPEIRTARHNVKWHVGGDAHVTFERVNKNGHAVCWLPDDPWMHNRLFLITSNPGTYQKMLKQGRLPNGEVKSALEINFELKCLDVILRHPIKVYKSMRDGKEECPFESRKDAENWNEDQGRTEVKLDSKGGLRPLKMNKAKYTIAESEVWVWKPEVKEMIAREKNRYQFGWTECKEFQDKWKPMIIDKIKAERDSFMQQSEQADVKDTVSAIKDMSDEAIEALYQRIIERKKKGKTRVREEEIAA